MGPLKKFNPNKYNKRACTVMPHLMVVLKSNYERSYTVITRFVSCVTEMLLPDNRELHLRIQKFPSSTEVEPMAGLMTQKTNSCYGMALS